MGMVILFREYRLIRKGFRDRFEEFWYLMIGYKRLRRSYNVRGKLEVCGLW